MLRTTPGGLSFQDPYAIASSGPTHRSGPRQRLAADTELRRCHQGPCDANPWHRDRTAWAAARWVCVLHPCAATASRSRLTKPREAPSDGPACGQYEAAHGCGDKLRKDFIFARRRANEAGIARRLLLSPLHRRARFRSPQRGEKDSECAWRGRQVQRPGAVACRAPLASCPLCFR